MPVLPTLEEACALDPKAIAAVVGDARRILVVGAGGWIGRVLLRGLHDALGKEQFKQRVVCFGSSVRSVDLGDGISVDQRPLDSLATLAPQPSLLFHLAFLTKDKVGEMDRDDYVRANRKLSRTVLDALASVGVDRLFVASSGAAAFADDEQASDDLRLYGQLKRADEELFAAWALDDPQRSAQIARIYSVSGPFINKHQTYALASFIKDAIEAKPIAVRAPMQVVRGYVALRELLSLVLVQMLEPNTQQVLPFDTGGDALELGDVAAVVAQVIGSKVERARITSEQDNIYAGANGPYQQLLAKSGIVPISLAQQIADTAVTLKETP